MSYTTWDNYRLEVLDSTRTLTVMLDDARGLRYKRRLFGGGEFSFNLHSKSRNATYLSETGQNYIRVWRRGVCLFDGVIMRRTRKYNEKGPWKSYLEVVGAQLSHIAKWRVGLPIAPATRLLATGMKVDDALKWLVERTLGATAPQGPDSTVRVFPSLSCVANASLHPTSPDLDMTAVELYLYLQRAGAYYDVDWEFSFQDDGSILFTTYYPRRGLDKTETNGARAPVIFNDAGVDLSGVNYYVDDINYRNAIIASDLLDEVTDSTGITAHGRREQVVATTSDTLMGFMLTDKERKVGYQFDFIEMPGLRYVTDFNVGDEITYNNLYLAYGPHDDTIAEVEAWITDDGQEHLKITLGDPEPLLKDEMKGGGVLRDNPIPTDTNVTAIPWGVVMQSAKLVVPDAYNHVFLYADPTGTGVTIDGTGGDPSMIYVKVTFPWYRDVVATPFLRPNTLLDDVHITGGQFVTYRPAPSVVENWHQTAAGNITGSQNDAGGGQAYVGAFGVGNSPVYRDFIMHGHDLGIHDIEVSGGIVSIPGGSASGLVWCGAVGGEDYIWCRQITGYNAVSTGAQGMTEPTLKRWALNNTGLTLYNGASNVTVGEWDRNNNKLRLWNTAGTFETFIVDGAEGSLKTKRVDGTLGVHIAATGDILGYDDDGTTQNYGLEAQDGGVGAVAWLTVGKIGTGIHTGRLNVYKGGNPNANAYFYEGGQLITAPGTDAAAVNFQLDGATGDLCMIKSVPYDFPAAQGAANTLLRNDGSGNLTWVTPASAAYWTDDATNLYPTTAGRDVIVRKADTTTTVTLTAATGNAVFAGRVDATGSLRATGFSVAAAGAGVEIDYSGGIGYVLAYNRADSAYLPLYIKGSTVTLYAGATPIVTVAAALVTIAKQISSTLAAGTAPIIVTSTTECTNLNAALLNGNASATAATNNTICLRDGAGGGTFAALGATAGTFSSTLSCTRLTSTIATGTSPLAVSSTTEVANLNVALLNGNASATAATNNTICLRDGSAGGTFAALTCTALTASTGNVTVTLGNVVLSAANATVDGVDLSAFKSAYDNHYHHFTPAGSIGAATITVAGQTDEETLLGSTVEGTYLYRWSGGVGTRVYVDAGGHVVTTTGGGELALGTGYRHHNHYANVGGTYSLTATQAAHAFSGTADIHTGTPL